ncbi:accessory gene regulator B family protein [Eubacterium callanderi]|uniref:accessory gene regulator B family protein n=1 Tax=Eubacterium callanderi TaxID=53442 RepID=UPI0034A36660
MTGKIAEAITTSCVRKKIINVDKQSVYRYGFELLISFFIHLTCFVTVAVISRRFLETFIFILAFASLRRYTGGYHAKTDIGCYGLTTISLVIYLVLLQYTPFSHQLMFIWFNLIVYWLAVFFIAPVTSDQKPINAIQLSRIKKHMWIISVAVTILCVIGTLASKGLKLSYMLSLVSILVAISIFATSMMKVFKKTDTRR